MGKRTGSVGCKLSLLAMMLATAQVSAVQQQAGGRAVPLFAETGGDVAPASVIELNKPPTGEVVTMSTPGGGESGSEPAILVCMSCETFSAGLLHLLSDPCTTGVLYADIHIV